MEANVMRGAAKPTMLATFTATSDTTVNYIELKWTVNAPYTSQIREFEIYKSEYTQGTTPLPKEALFKIIKGTELLFLDEFPGKNKVNKYMIRAVTTEGKLSDWKTVTINY